MAFRGRGARIGGSNERCTGPRLPRGTKEQYEEVVERMQLGGHMAPGGAVHVAGSHDGGWRLIDVWDSLQTFERFRDEQFVPPTQAAGLRPPQGRMVEVDDEMADDGRGAAFVQCVISKELRDQFMERTGHILQRARLSGPPTIDELKDQATMAGSASART